MFRKSVNKNEQLLQQQVASLTKELEQAKEDLNIEKNVNEVSNMLLEKENKSIKEKHNNSINELARELEINETLRKEKNLDAAFLALARRKGNVKDFAKNYETSGQAAEKLKDLEVMYESLQTKFSNSQKLNAELQGKIKAQEQRLFEKDGGISKPNDGSTVPQPQFEELQAKIKLMEKQLLLKDEEICSVKTSKKTLEQGQEISNLNTPKKTPDQNEEIVELKAFKKMVMQELNLKSDNECSPEKIRYNIVSGKSQGSIPEFGIDHEYGKVHDGEITGIDFTLDGKFVVTVSSDSKMKLWGIDRKNLEYTWPQFANNALLCVSITPDCKYIYCGGRDKTLIMIDFETREIIEQISCTNKIYNSKVSSNSNLLLTGHFRTVNLWKIEGSKTSQIFSKSLDHQDNICSVCFSIDQKSLFCGSDKGSIYKLDIKDGNIICKMRAHVQEIYCIQQSVCGDHLYTVGHDDGHLKQWNIFENYFDLNHNYGKVGTWIFCQQLSKNGEFGFTSSGKGGFKQWDFQEKKLFKDYGKLVNGTFKGSCISNSDKIMMIGTDNGSLYQIQVKD